MESPYFNLQQISDAVAAGKHREIIGGLWESVGVLQKNFLISEGLRPEHKLLDVGCGALRGGVHFIAYLDSNNYYGTDISRDLLDVGYEIELAKFGVQERLNRSNLVCNGDFSFPWPDGFFDYAIAQSVFTHLAVNNIRLCLSRLAKKMKVGGRFYATFFEISEGEESFDPSRHEPGGIVTYGAQDPYHYKLSEFKQMIRGLPWRLHYIGEWDHPRAQRLLCFEKQPEAHSCADQQLRSADVEEAGNLPPGADHYRAYVGPPNRFDFMSASQFSLLFQCGLREHHKLLDFGAGSLRVGRLLIPYLRSGKYHAIEPNTWLVDDGVARELGYDALHLKKPEFSSDNSFDCSVFGKRFDFIIAQSILTHCEVDLFKKLVSSFSSSLEDEGLVLFSYLDSPIAVDHPAKGGWVYPGCVEYTGQEVQAMLGEAGLFGMAIPWFHPGANWFLAARSMSRLPTAEEAALLRGAVLFDPQFARSRSFPFY